MFLTERTDRRLLRVYVSLKYVHRGGNRKIFMAATAERKINVLYIRCWAHEKWKFPHLSLLPPQPVGRWVGRQARASRERENESWWVEEMEMKFFGFPFDWCTAPNAIAPERQSEISYIACVFTSFYTQLPSTFFNQIMKYGFENWNSGKSGLKTDSWYSSIFVWYPY